MGREYSNKRSSKTRSGALQQFLVITVTFLLGYLTATVCDFETVSRWVNTQVLAYSEMNKAPSKPKAQKKAAIPPKPKFEFYTLLTNEKTPSSAANQPATATTKPEATAVKVSEPPVVIKTVAPAPPTGRTYSVQVASFKARQDAEQMKVLLILKGFNVSVVPISHASRGNWFRVVVGPYANRTLAQQAQIDLANNEHLRGMLTVGG